MIRVTQLNDTEFLVALDPQLASRLRCWPGSVEGTLEELFRLATNDDLDDGLPF